MKWAEPRFLWLLALLPALVGLYVGYWVWKLRVAARLGNPTLVRGRSGRKQILRFALTALAVTLISLGLARPQWGERSRTVKREGVDLVIALDISRSMLAADVNPSRLRAAKDELDRVLGQLRGDRVGLVVFTGISFAQAPLTTDYGAIRFYLRRLDPDDMPVGGTASGRALVDAVELLTGERLGRGGEGDTPSPDAKMKRARTQLVVLISDGEDHQGDPLKAAELAAERGIRVYTVGFGSANGEPIPVVDARGQTQYLRDRQGNTVYTKLNDGPLREVAQKTGGQYFHYEGQGSMANAITTALNDMEKEELASLLRVEGEDRFYVFLFPALLCLLLALLLGERRGLHLDFWRRQPTRPGSHGDELKLWRDAGTVLLASSVGLLALGSQGCDQLHETFVIRKVRAVEQGNAALAAGESAEALERYKQAEREIPGRPELNYDLGLGFLANAQGEQAIANLARAVESSDEDLRFKALFNLGVSHFRQEQWKESLEAFKGALRLQPASQEAKIAYEVALMKVYPPCSALEDDLEDNDTFDAATDMQEPEVKERVLCGGDDDWFGVPIYAGSIIRARADFTRLREREPGDPEMLPKEDMLRLVLFGADGETILGVSQAEPVEPGQAPPSPEDDKKGKKEEKASRAIGPMKLTPEMLQVVPGAQDLGKAFLRVVADQGLEFKYDVALKVIPPCFALEEELEDNDSAATPAELPDGAEHRFHVCEGDPDWFALPIEAGETIFIDVMAGFDEETESSPVLDVGLFEADGVTRIGEVEEVQTPQGRIYGVQLREAVEARRLLLKVSSLDPGVQGPYQVFVYRFGACGAPNGDDRFEDNDDASSGAELIRGQGPIRHLRHCPGDQDYFTVATQEKDRVALGVKYDELETDAELDGPPMKMRLWNEAGDTLVIDGVPVEAAAPMATPVHLVLATEELEEATSFVLEVSSEAPTARYYHIVPVEGDKAQEQPQQGDQQQEPQDGDQEQEPQDGEDQKPQDGDQEQEQEPQEQEQESESDPEEERREAVEELLENLEDSDDNFQLKKALENVPDRYIENDW